MSSRRQLLQSLSTVLLSGGAPGAWAADAFQMAYFETYSPLSFMEGGNLRGLLVDTLEAVLHKRLGFACQHEGLPWPRAQAMVERGERDAICTIATPERLVYAIAASEPVITAPTCIYLHADHPRANEFASARNLEELRAMKPEVVSYSANGWAKAKLAGFNVVWGNDFNSAVKMLISRRGDMVIENMLVMSYTLARTPGGERIRLLRNRMDQANFQLLVSRKSHLADRVPEISRAIAAYKDSPQYAAIFGRYGVPYMA